MATCNSWQFSGRIRSSLWRLILLAVALTLCGCASIVAEMVPATTFKTSDEVACDKHQTVISPVSEELCGQVNELIHKEAGLPDAKIGFDVQGKGRLQLAGKYKDEQEVEKAFAIAQAMVGSEWVSPVTPGHIKVEDWQKCLKKKIAGQQCDDRGTEAYSLDKTPPGPVRDKYALIIGVGRFKNGIKKLNFAVKDAKAISNYLTDPKLGKFPADHVTVLTDEQATSTAILTALDDLERRAKPDDLIVVYFSSHGAPPDKFEHVNIITYDTDLLFGKQDFDTLSEGEKLLQRQSVWDTSIPRQRLHDFFRKTQSKRVLMILDVCYSGDVFMQIPGYKPRGSETLAKSEEHFSSGYSADQLMAVFGAKDLALEDNKGQPVQTSAQPPVSGKKTAKKSKKTSDALTKSWGKVIISASNGKERSWEPDPNIDAATSNSYFTYFFLNGLQQTNGLVQDSFQSAVPEVAAAAKQKGTTQQPQFFSIPNLNNWNFSVNSHR